MKKYIKKRPRKAWLLVRTVNGFTLVEVLITMSLSVVLLAGVASLLLSSNIAYQKSSIRNNINQKSSLVHQHLTTEISTAVKVPELSMGNPQKRLPDGSLDPSDTSAGSSFALMTYFVTLGDPGILNADISYDTDTPSLVVTLKGTSNLNRPVAGDYLVLATPKLGENGARIASVSDGRAEGADGTVTITLASALSALTTESSTWTDTDGTTRVKLAKAGQNVAFWRQRAYEVERYTADNTATKNFTRLISNLR